MGRRRPETDEVQHKHSARIKRVGEELETRLYGWSEW